MDVIKISKVLNAYYYPRTSGKSEIEGVLSITLTHLIFQELPKNSETVGDVQVQRPLLELFIPVSLIARIERTSGTRRVVIFTKNFRVHEFKMGESDANGVASSLSSLSTPEKLQELYAFHFKSALDDCVAGTRGGDGKELINSFSLSDSVGHTDPTVSSLVNEFIRMGIRDSEQWKIDYTINSNYQLADSYPSVVVVPAKCNKLTIEGSAKFRSRGRLPVLTYLHQNGAAICRSSQPLVGMSKLAGARSTNDEDLCQMIAKLSPSSYKKYLFILDTRPKVNAWANKWQGKGYETEEFYPFIKFEFSNIENVHVMRSSLARVLEATEKKPSSVSVSQNLSEISRSGWLKHIRAIVEASLRVVTIIEGSDLTFSERGDDEEKDKETFSIISNSWSPQNVLVHCSDGWDRTSQVCSIAALLLDPFYRTFEGLIALIEKDWLAFGHKFTDRCGFIEGDVREISPIFTQFLDVLWQLQFQFPTHFEYNERLLIEMHTELYQCKYGTFLGNNEKERIDLKIKESTKSLWSHLRKNKEHFMNPFYNPKNEPQVLRPTLQADAYRLWTKMYSSWETPSNSIAIAESIMTKYTIHNSYLMDHKRFLEAKLSELRKNLNNFDCSTVLANTNEVLKKLEISPSRAQDQIESESNIQLPSLNMIEAETVDGNVDPLGSNRRSTTTSATECGFEVVNPSNCVPENFISNSSFVDYLNLTPTKLVEDTNETFSIDESFDMCLVWDDLHASKTCYFCKISLESFFRKLHCISCGHVFCGEKTCIDHLRLDSMLHSNKKEAPICKICSSTSQKNQKSKNLQINCSLSSDVPKTESNVIK